MTSSPAGIACIVCSWGGLAALRVLLGALPADFPLPICIVQHRATDGDTSTLAGLLDNMTPLTVRDAEDKDPLQAGVAYLAPAGYHLLVEDEHVALSTDDHVRWSRPSADVLLETASAAFGPGVIAIVLTGANDDGARGARRVKAAGGTVIVQDPQTAERAEMPQATMRAVTADAVVRLDEIAHTLTQRAAAMAGADAERS